MPNERAIARYRHWYRKLLRLYSRAHRERFAESMEQTFNDLCRERIGTGKGLGGFVLGVFVETLAAVIRERMRLIMMQSNVVRMAFIVGLLLLIPWWANQNIDGWNWDRFDFIFAGALLFGTGLTYELVAKRGGTTAYRAAVAIACAAGLLLVWINAAVGIIGSEDNPANAMYILVLFVGFLGAIVARLQPRGMARALTVTALAQAIVPVIALVFWRADFSPGVVPVFVLNAFFVTLWIVSALLFRHAADPRGRHCKVA
jgi:hypothetical protein